MNDYFIYWICFDSADIHRQGKERNTDVFWTLTILYLLQSSCSSFDTSLPYRKLFIYYFPIFSIFVFFSHSLVCFVNFLFFFFKSSRRGHSLCPMFNHHQIKYYYPMEIFQKNVSVVTWCIKFVPSTNFVIIRITVLN